MTRRTRRAVSAAVWDRIKPHLPERLKDPSDQVESTAQVFLGVRLQCARCHHHPFDQWSQQDYYGLAAFFSRVGRKYGKEYQANVERIFHNRGLASVPHPRTKVPVLPTGAGHDAGILELHSQPQIGMRCASGARDLEVRQKRKKLAQATGGKHYIETVWGRGYVLRDPVEAPAALTPGAGSGNVGARPGSAAA